MQKTSIILLIGLVCLSSFNSTPNPVNGVHPIQQTDILAGIWKYINGNEVFIVNIWRMSDGYRGHYKKIIVDANGNQVSEVYNSYKPIGNSTTYWPYSIYSGNISTDFEVRAVLSDNTVTNAPNGGGFLEAVLEIKILNPNCFTPPTNACPLQAQWTVKKDNGVQNPDDPPLSVPTNIVLTKQ
ncbi:MAG TPA: hypothetical protein PKA77_08135 [Chitinophagaceae bacterium]|jgi:hypothetical protein|nr:hypothetical protein [Chitinophagaceae bacterium]HMU59230.1 hypothetical protein [Chitinophagaceae bacterium]